jgi:lipopolysaccharide transport system permease protein
VRPDRTATCITLTRMASLAEFARSRELLVNLVLRELRSRYKKSLLGWTWSLLNPVASVIVYSIVFSVFLKIQPPTGDPSGLHSFVVFLLCALIPWNFFANSLSTSVESLVGNAGLIKKVYFPRQLLVAAAVGSLLVSALIEMGVLCVVLLASGNMVLPWLPLVAVLIVLQALFVFGIGLVLSACNVYLRDVRHFVAILLQVLFYSAPIVYPLRLVPHQRDLLGVSVPIGDIYRLNPLVQFFQAYRNLLYDLRFPSLGTWAQIVAWTGIALAFGLWAFGKLDRRLAEEV